MPPPRLDHSNFWIGKEMDSAFEQVLFRNKIGVEDAKKLALRSSESHPESASLKAGPISPMDQMNVETALSQFLSTSLGDLSCLIHCIDLTLDLLTLQMINDSNN